MYKFLSCMLSALLFAACSSADDPAGDALPDYGGDAISFGVPAVTTDRSVTRAVLMNAIEPHTVFGVSGYCVPYQLAADRPDWQGGNSDWLTKKSLVHADVMYREPVFYDGVKCVYSSDGTHFNRPKHWYIPQETGLTNTGRFLYSFIAYHPYGLLAEGGGFSFSPADDAARGIPKLTYTMPYRAGGSLSDVLDADASEDAMIAASFDHSSTQGAVQFEFWHLLTGLRLQINNYNAADAANPRVNTVTVHSLSVEGDFYRTAEIDFTPADPSMSVTGETFSGMFRFAGEADGLQVAPNSARIVGTSADAPQGTVLLLLPKFDAAAGGATSSIPYLGTRKTIEIEYSYEGKGRVKRRIENFSLGRVPEQGTCYTINLNFIGDQLLLMFTADAIEYWESGSDNDIIIN